MYDIELRLENAYQIEVAYNLSRVSSNNTKTTFNNLNMTEKSTKNSFILVKSS